MTKTFLTLAAAGLALSIATPVLADPPQAKIVVIDRAAIMQFSKVGQDIAKQMQAYATQAKNDLSAQGSAQETGHASSNTCRIYHHTLAVPVMTHKRQQPFV